MSLTFADILAAAERLRGVAHHTPVITSRTLDERTGRQVFMKCENQQRAGAFKFRGAYNAIVGLPPEQRANGVLAYSSGNHAQGTALAARLLGIPAVIVMPQDAPAVKIAATRSYGAEVIFYNRFTDDREQVARSIAADRRMPIIPPYESPEVMAGQGTAALELLDAVPDLAALVAPISGGGLLGGTAVAAHGRDPQISVYGVEPAAADDSRQSLLRGERVTISPPDTIADGLRAVTPGAVTFPVLKEHVREIVTVTEAEIIDAVRFGLTRLKTVLEPSGAVGLAAVLSDKLPAGARRIGVILSGGNIEPEVLRQALDA